MPMIVPEPFETERLVVRPARVDDLPALLVVNGDDAVTRFLPYATWRSIADAERWWDRTQAAQAAGTAVQFVVALRRTDAVVGSCLLFRFEQASQRAELGYAMGRAHWRRGLMREALAGLFDTAFGAMQLRLIDAEIDTRNAPSHGLLLGLGFTLEGTLRQRWIARGEARDVRAYGLLRHEWPPAARAAGPQLDRLDHLVLTVADIDASIAFYKRAMGMRAVRFGAGRTALAFGRQKINLHPAAAPIAPHAERPTAGSADLCFIAATPLDAVLAHLRREGVEIIEGPVPRTGALGPIRSVYFRDPDGNLIEVSEDVDASA